MSGGSEATRLAGLCKELANQQDNLQAELAEFVKEKAKVDREVLALRQKVESKSCNKCEVLEKEVAYMKKNQTLELPPELQALEGIDGGDHTDFAKELHVTLELREQLDEVSDKLAQERQSSKEQVAGLNRDLEELGKQNAAMQKKIARLEKENQALKAPQKAKQVSAQPNQGRLTKQQESELKQEGQLEALTKRVAALLKENKEKSAKLAKCTCSKRRGSISNAPSKDEGSSFSRVKSKVFSTPPPAIGASGPKADSKSTPKRSTSRGRSSTPRK